MLPNDPEFFAPPKDPDTPTPVSASLVLFYCIAGAVSGAIDGGIAGGTTYAIGRWNQPEAVETGYGAVNCILIALPPPDPVTECAASAGIGLFVGFLCGLILSVIVSAWPAARHPVRAASLFASLGGTVCLILIVPPFREMDPKNLLVVAAAVVLGAIFGFLTSWLTQLMERVAPARWV